MKEMKFINEFKSQFSGKIDSSKEIYADPELRCAHPFVVELDGLEVGCIYLHYEHQMVTPMVWVMYLKSYSRGYGSKILNMLCSKADEDNICLYLEPVPDEGSELVFSELVPSIDVMVLWVNIQW